jgi:hypothetical protein
MKLLVEQAMLQFFVAVKVRESKQLFLKVRKLLKYTPYISTPPPPLTHTPGTSFSTPSTPIGH